MWHVRLQPSAPSHSLTHNHLKSRGSSYSCTFNKTAQSKRLKLRLLPPRTNPFELLHTHTYKQTLSLSVSLSLTPCLCFGGKQTLPMHAMTGACGAAVRFRYSNPLLRMGWEANVTQHLGPTDKVGVSEKEMFHLHCGASGGQIMEGFFLLFKKDFPYYFYLQVLCIAYLEF